MIRTLTTLGALMIFASPAMAYDALQGCYDYVAEHGGVAEACPCIAEEAEKDPAVNEALSKITTPEELEEAEEFVLDVVRKCAPSVLEE